MATNQGTDVLESRAQTLAAELDCFTEDDFLLLSEWTELTARERRKRGDGPPFIRFGKRVLYPKAQALEHFKQRAGSKRTLSAKDVL